MVGELGDFRKAIAYVGDTVNTTSRIQAECSKRDVPLIVSGDLLGRLPGEIETRSLGTMTLRGKAKDVELYEVRGVR